jgi:hypothetical protein
MRFWRAIKIQIIKPPYKGISRAGGGTQVVEHLPSKCEALRSNPSTEKKKKRKKRHIQVLVHCFSAETTGRICVGILF